MKKIIITFFVLGCCMMAKAQSDVFTATLLHGNDVSVFIGINALVEAHEAAQDDDVISLSSGTFSPTTITKSVTIYGAGFEKNTDAGTDVTQINNNLNIGVADATLSNVHIEGVKINGVITLVEGATVEGLVVKRCYLTKGFTHSANTKNTLIQECIFTGGFTNNETTQATVAENLSINNCFISGNVNTFGASSSVVVDHSIVTGFAGGYLWKNCILPYRAIGAYADWGAFEGNGGTTGATVINCIVTILYSDAAKNNNVFTDCYLGVDDMFSDSPGPRNYTYSSERTYELKNKEEWLGNDNTEVGIRGGNGWSKAPSIPVIKSLSLGVDGNDLKVTYEAEVR